MLEVFWRTILRGTIANEAAKEMPQFSDVFVKTQKRGLGFAPAVTVFLDAPCPGADYGIPAAIRMKYGQRIRGARLALDRDQDAALPR